jgi:hypothetical protein
MRNREEAKRKLRGEIVRVEDLAPRTSVKGGGKLRFGERREDGDGLEPKPSDPARPRRLGKAEQL